MRIFVTGATGNIGSYVVRELIDAGHEVLGLSRSPTKEAALAAVGAEILRGSVSDPETLKSGVARADGVIHLAFNHDFSRFKQNCEDDRGVIANLGLALAGTAKPLVVTSGTPMANTVPGEPARERNPVKRSDEHPRAASEEAAALLVAQGLNVSVVRLPQVHDVHSQGLVSPAIDLYRAKGECVYVGDGANRWPAGHMTDVARLFRLAVERAEPGAKYHAVVEEGVSMRSIAETIGERLNLPVRSISPDETGEFFGWLSMFAGLDMPASSEWTREVLGWKPDGPTLLADLANLEAAED